MSAQALTLYTFSVSHFSEKTRWMLDCSGLPYQEKPLVPFFHIPTTLKLGGKRFTTVPILAAGEQRIQDSTRIFEWLQANRGPLALMPQDSAQREAAMELEAKFDRVGSQLIRFAYAKTLDDAEGVLTLWTLDATPLQSRLLKLSYPLLRAMFKRTAGVTAANVQKAEQSIQSMLDLIAERSSASHPYLIGNQFSVADLTAAALLAPLVCPDQHPVYSLPRYRKGIAEQVARWQQHPGFAWVRMIYAKHRR